MLLNMVMFKVTICDLKRVVTYVCKGYAFSL